MNYSILKKAITLSFASLMFTGSAMAQTVDTTSTPKSFNGIGQYKKFSIGLNAGVTAPSVATGGTNDFTHNQIKLGYGISAEEQLSHSVGLQIDVHGGEVQGNNSRGLGTNPLDYPASSFDTRFWSATLSGLVNVGNISFTHRQSGVNFFVTGGAGYDLFAPKVIYKDGTVVNWKGNAGNPDGGGRNEYVKELVVPVGVGAKFRLTDVTSINIGYTENFVDDDVFDGVKRGYPSNDKYSYGYAGLEFTLGSHSKRSLAWVNPVAVMYDELYDQQLRDEVKSLGNRVTNVEVSVNDLKKDSDNDGVSDEFDKCPNTPVGSVVDGSGCTIVFPKDTLNSTVWFSFNSSVVPTAAYPSLDMTVNYLKSDTTKSIEIDGYASSEGTASHNIKLSQDRAESVKNYLTNAGINPTRIVSKGLGETNPISDNSTESGRAKNRRVEFVKK